MLGLPVWAKTTSALKRAVDEAFEGAKAEAKASVSEGKA